MDNFLWQVVVLIFPHPNCHMACFPLSASLGAEISTSGAITSTDWSSAQEFLARCLWNDVWISMSCSWKLYTLSSRVWMAPNEPAILDGLYSLYMFIQFIPPTSLVKWGWLTIGVLLPQIFGSRNCLRLGSLELATPRSASPPQTTGVPTSEDWGGSKVMGDPPVVTMVVSIHFNSKSWSNDSNDCMIWGYHSMTLDTFISLRNT